ncbi:MAG TPA: alpha/beta fold hydrolase [Gemmatimonadaceae bacterium]|nr:alpha/beta fold hydrolase [Gemmatimonadaceae bacterium]
MNTLRFFSLPLIVTSSLVSATAAAQAVDTSTLRSRGLTSAIDTVPPKSVIETPFTIQSGTLALPGTLTVPANYDHQIPVALIVAGSGPTDRNGNSAGPLRAQNNSNLYAILAWQLATAGIASVRYDKRVLGENVQKIDLTAITIDDFIADAIAGARRLVADRRFSKVILIGHSEGAELVLQAVNRGAPAAGIVMMSGAGRPITSILREQLSKQLPAAEVVMWDSAFARYLRGEEPGDVHPGLRPLLQPTNRRFMQGWVKYDPSAEIAKVKVPVLIVQGGRDIQVNESDARALKAAQPAAKLVVIPSANHVFRAATTDNPAMQIKLYTNPTIPIVPELAPAIVEWVAKLK